MSTQKAPVIIDGIKVTNTSKCWQIARTVRGEKSKYKGNSVRKKQIVIRGKTPKETFLKFVNKCESLGINYKTDFDPLDLPKAQRGSTQYGVTRQIINGDKVLSNEERLEKLTELILEREIYSQKVDKKMGEYKREMLNLIS